MVRACNIGSSDGFFSLTCEHNCNASSDFPVLSSIKPFKA